MTVGTPARPPPLRYSMSGRSECGSYNGVSADQNDASLQSRAKRGKVQRKEWVAGEEPRRQMWVLSQRRLGSFILDLYLDETGLETRRLKRRSVRPSDLPRLCAAA